MRIFYQTRKLQGFCENSRKAAQKLGPDSARIAAITVVEIGDYHD